MIWSRLTLMLLLFLPLSTTAQLIQVSGSPEALIQLLNQAKEQFENNESENAAATLERALRIDPHNPILWHNLAGVRLQQEDWKRAAGLAQKSNSLAEKDSKLLWLRVRNWVVISLACEGLGDMECVSEAKKRAHILADQ